MHNRMHGAGDTRAPNGGGGGGMRSYGSGGGGGFYMGTGAPSSLPGGRGGAPALFRVSQQQQQQQQPQFCMPSDGSFPAFAMKAEALGAPLHAYPETDAATTTATRRASLVDGQRELEQEQQQQEQEQPVKVEDNQQEHNRQPKTEPKTESKAKPKMKPRMKAKTELERPRTVTRMTATGEIHVIRRRNVGVPKFLRFLFQILESEDPSIISWAHDGTAFQIQQPDQLSAQILPKYFKHNKVSSFQRQLNYFGFKKWTKTQTTICTFSHPCFLRHDKNRMKLIKRKERASPAITAVSTSASSTGALASPPSIHLAPAQSFSQSHSASSSPIRQSVPPPESKNPALQAPMTPNQVAQKALKRQKSSSMATGAAAAFLNSAMAGRRHSTGMLPGAEAFSMGMAAAAAAAKSSANGRKRTGAPDQQELGLELEARADALARASSPQQQLHQLRKLAAAKELSVRHSSKAARGKRNSLPHMLQPNFGETMGSGMALNGGMGLNFGSTNSTSFGRRKSEQLMADFNANSGRNVPVTQFTHLLTSTASSGSPQQSSAFQTSSIKNEASAVLPISSDTLMQGAYQQQQQRSNRQNAMFGSGYNPQMEPRADMAMRDISGPLQTQPGGWATSTGSGYRPQPNGYMAPTMFPFKFGDPNAAQANMPAGFEGVNAVEYSQQRSQRQATSMPPQSQQQYQPPKDYIDVLLESAGLNENLPTEGSGSWDEPNGYTPPQQPLQPAHYAIMHQQQLQSQQRQQNQNQNQNQNQFQLSPMGGMPSHPDQRF